jgi:hypothetical protein
VSTATLLKHAIGYTRFAMNVCLPTAQHNIEGSDCRFLLLGQTVK